MDALDLVMRSEKKTFLSVKSSVLMRFVNLQRVFLCPSFWADFFLTRGYAQAYHELLQGLRYANESLTHS